MLGAWNLSSQPSALESLVQVSKSVKYKRESRDSNIDKVDTPAMVRAHYKAAETLLSDVQKEYQWKC